MTAQEALTNVVEKIDELLDEAPSNACVYLVEVANYCEYLIDELNKNCKEK